MPSVTEEVKRGIRQLRVIEDRFLNGTLDPVLTRNALQALIEIKSDPISSSESWYASAPKQIEKVLAFLEQHGDKNGFTPSDIPSMPNLVRQTRTEILLLTVMLPDEGGVSGIQRTFDAWWNFIPMPADAAKTRGVQLRSDTESMRLAPNINYSPGIRWVAFDPNAYMGTSPEDALRQSSNGGNATLAHAEVLMAAAMFPDMSMYMNMAGLQLRDEASWSFVPCIVMSNRHRSLTELKPMYMKSAYADSSSPTVREC